MTYISQREYYTNNGVNPTDTNWGSYQYISLDDLMTNFELMYEGNHSLVNNENRYKILFHTKRAIQDKDESQEDEMIRQLTNNKVKVKKDKKVKKNGNNRKQHNSK